MKRTLYIIGLLFIVAVGHAQQKLKKADALFEEYAYVDAAKAYEEYLEKAKHPSAETVTKAADAYYFTGNCSSAHRWYTKLYQMQGSEMDDRHFNRYIQTVRAAEEYQKADDLLKQRMESKGDKALTEKVIRQMKYLDSLNKAPALYTLRNLASNSSKADFGTAFYGNRIVYSSSKDTTEVGGKVYQWNEQPFLDLYVAERNVTDGSFSNETKFIPREQTQYHNAAVAFTPDLKRVYYSTNNVKNIKSADKLQNDDRGTNHIEMVTGKIDGEKLAGVRGVPFNSQEYSVGHPAITADGKWMFFVSDMPGGYGETDIYVSQVFGDGRLGEPKNLGPVINTEYKEMFPFINDSILYFASNGHYGLGGLDVFESRLIKDLEFAEPKNLGRPVNSNMDDFAYIISKEKTYGYVSSNRAGGKGDDDIYFFSRREPECKQIVMGKVTNLKYKIPINGAMVKVYDKFGDAIASVQTAEDGSYRIEAPCGSQVIVEASKENHTKESKDLTTTKKPGAGIKDIDFVLSNYEDLVKKEDNMEKVDINPIFFEFDKWNITPQAAEELDKVVYVMKNFPAIIIKIESHTDSRGKDEYNLKLSDNRAKSTYEYIVSKGIDASRIESVKGYGETRLRNKCSNNVKCTEEEHLLNRRSDFIIVQK